MRTAPVNEADQGHITKENLIGGHFAPYLPAP
jgi:hypothetical protein